jgi:hypothetical protein
MPRHGGRGQSACGEKLTPALAGKGRTFEALSALMRPSHGGINPYTAEQMSDAALKEIALFLQDPATPAPDGAYSVHEDEMVTPLACERDGRPMNGRDGLIQVI